MGGLRILGIETSCDETAAAVVHRREDGTGEILSDVVLSQLDLHAAFGGVVPELAARSHVSVLDRLVSEALADSGVALGDIDAIAVTSGPGLIGGLMVGLMTAKAIAMAMALPFLGVNHLEGHALTARLTDNVAFPYLLLLVSGGHTQIVLVNGVGDYERWGTTIDDALGEAFDKTAKLLGLGYPGGPAVEQAALSGVPRRFRLPVPMRRDPRLDFSFSGLKTAVRQMAEAEAPLSDQTIADLCLAFQLSVTASLDDRIAMALERFSQRFGTGSRPALVVAGGVAANKAIRTTLEARAGKAGFRFIAPPLNLCTDNAAMIAWAGAERMAAGLPFDGLDLAPRSRWPLDEAATALIGHGKRGAKA
ncbi:MAG: tRNA (adenosine(37)-N6)-threonylcarbamoyltransferase complex transferase subunit TsaD [Hoeflea sp.]|uniref:tRNA (adenosine(37)-N6)-threonylcarbamoyltransferase complex transferase subunit TsaD n=1 Tax=Hoeflea sp. TaxID=1940281 RepID=UPI00273170A2|nr:tRNA (adenosine(37)-N6)-threonylcarbamoyltransferase complex transferase subunit TsaD [Hoeflea sp.]MDP2121455.1 tRNA (adenosine(37)-N6)-threonylcarbamoyltransferase complex transferase subunit TsaD [Hoeflea sp.]